MLVWCSTAQKAYCHKNHTLCTQCSLVDEHHYVTQCSAVACVWCVCVCVNKPQNHVSDLHRD